MIICGIDPGISGAMCVMETLSQKIIELVDMPILTVEKSGKTKSGKKKSGNVVDGPAVKGIITKAYDNLGSSLIEFKNISHVFIEKAQVMPDQGSVSGFNYGTGYGLVVGICIGLSIPYSLIRPNMWKKAMMQGMTKGKDASIVRVKQLYPDIENLERKKDHGRADAVLISLHGISGGYL